MKTIPLKYCANVLQPEQRRGNLVKISGNGLGFTLIRRSVFQKISNQYQDLKYFPKDYQKEFPVTEKEYNNSYHFFSECKHQDTFLSEDMSFFHRAYTNWI